MKSCPQLLCAAFVLATVARAQEGNYWDALPLPGPLTAPVVAFGTNVTIRTATDVYVYSGVLRTWTQIPVSPAAVVYSEYNDHVIVRDGTTVHGWSTRTGQVTSITVSPTATVIAGTTGRTWTAAVVDGSTVYAYAGFTGTWATLTTAGPPTVTLDKVTMLVEDGTAMYALSAHFGVFVAAPTALVLRVSENVVLAVEGTDVVWGYSALGNTWASHTLAGASTGTVSAGFTYALLQAGSTMLGYSADTQSFAEYPASSTLGTPVIAPEAGAFTDGSDVVGFGPATCVFAAESVGGTPTLQPAENRFGSFIMASEPGVLHAFSGVTGSFAAPLTGTYSLTLSDTCAFASSGTQSYAYNALMNLWSPSPIAAPTISTLLYNGVVVTDGLTQSAYSTRNDSWSTLSQPAGTVAIHGSLYSTTSGTHVDLFDSRLARWTSFDTAAAPNPLSVWRLTAITHDGANAYGFSLFTGIPSSTPLQGTVQEYRANSEIAFVRTDTHLHTFTSLGSLSMRFRYPEHSRGQARGTPLFLQQTGPAGSLVRGHVGLGHTYQPLGSLGILMIDMGQPHFPYLAGVVPASGVLDIEVPVPADASLNGLQVHVQHLVKPVGGSWWLTNSVSPILL